MYPLASGNIMSADCGIYAIENVRDRRAYVGATKRGFLVRWATHRTALNRGTHHIRLLQNDWHEYGPGWFKFLPLEVLLLNEMFSTREQIWIDRLASLGYSSYNVRPACERPENMSRRSIPLRSTDYCFTIQEVADYLRIHSMTVLAMVHSGELKAFRVRRNWRVTRESLQTVLDAHASSPPPTQEPDIC
jgi:excisionase family DNA binding protein